jgi:hypothetical protein
MIQLALMMMNLPRLLVQGIGLIRSSQTRLIQHFIHTWRSVVAADGASQQHYCEAVSKDNYISRLAKCILEKKLQCPKGRSLPFDETQNAEQTFGICDALRENRALRLTESRAQ